MLLPAVVLLVRMVEGISRSSKDENVLINVQIAWSALARSQTIDNRVVISIRWRSDQPSQPERKLALKYYFVFLEVWPRFPSMPNLYFCQPHAKNQGMLRAVLSMNECERVLSQHPAEYVGEDFPQLGAGHESANDFAVISFRPEEITAAWRPGYYRVDSDLNKLNESLLALSR